MRRLRLLRVVELAERPYAMIAQALVVEEDGGDDKRAREASSPGLVRARDVTNAEAPVEVEAASGRCLRTAKEDSAQARCFSRTRAFLPTFSRR